MHRRGCCHPQCSKSSKSSSSRNMFGLLAAAHSLAHPPPHYHLFPPHAAQNHLLTALPHALLSAPCCAPPTLLSVLCIVPCRTSSCPLLPQTHLCRPQHPQLPTTLLPSLTSMRHTAPTQSLQATSSPAWHMCKQHNTAANSPYAWPVWQSGLCSSLVGWGHGGGSCNRSAVYLECGVSFSALQAG
jgi:hypothetical protein